MDLNELWGESRGNLFGDIMFWILTVVCTILAFTVKRLTNKIKCFDVQWNAMHEGTKAMLRSNIINEYEKYKSRGGVPIYARENIEDLYKHYKVLGGNGVIDGLIKELGELPTK